VDVRFRLRVYDPHRRAWVSVCCRLPSGPCGGADHLAAVDEAWAGKRGMREEQGGRSPTGSLTISPSPEGFPGGSLRTVGVFLESGFPAQFEGRQTYRFR